jgi:hypothetical protein
MSETTKYLYLCSKNVNRYPNGSPFYLLNDRLVMKAEKEEAEPIQKSARRIEEWTGKL